MTSRSLPRGCGVEVSGRGLRGPSWSEEMGKKEKNLPFLPIFGEAVGLETKDGPEKGGSTR